MERSTSSLESPANIQFDFDNRVFSVEGAVFKRTTGDGEVALYVPMGDTMAAVPLKQLRSVFDIAPDSDDDKLLGYVTRGLDFVREIHPGDSVPSEVLTGEASWLVDEQYLAAAKARITMQLVAWLTGEEFENVDMNEILMRAESKETKELVQQAFRDIAEKLGYGPDGREDVIKLVDRFAQELSYIEALRAQLGKIKRIMSMLKDLYRANRSDSNLREAISRCTTLIEKPVNDIFEKFDALDANSGEILNTLRQYDAQVEYVRKVRDQLRQTYLLWEDILGTWSRVDGMNAPEAEHAIRETYRFAAQHFVQTDNWSLSV